MLITTTRCSVFPCSSIPCPDIHDPATFIVVVRLPRAAAVVPPVTARRPPPPAINATTSFLFVLASIWIERNEATSVASSCQQQTFTISERAFQRPGEEQQ